MPRLGSVGEAPADVVAAAPAPPPTRRWLLLIAAALVPAIALVLLLLGDGGGRLAERLGWLAALAALAVVADLRLRRLRARAFGERHAREHLESTLGRFVSRRVAQLILGGDAAPRRQQVTVLFCDLRGFTFMCERERPEDVVALLNDFFEEACAAIEAHGGIVNKLLGDGLLALFGATHERPGHADDAALAALQVMDTVGRLRARGGEWTHLAVGVGLDTGEVVLGPIGSRDRAEYTAIGSPVNRAARLQSLGERENRRVIVSQATRRAFRRRFRLGALGTVALKGFVGLEEAFYLLGPSASTHVATPPPLPPGPGARAPLLPDSITSVDPEPTGETHHDLPGLLSSDELSASFAPTSEPTVPATSPRRAPRGSRRTTGENPTHPWFSTTAVED